MSPPDAHVEPSAASTAEARRRLLGLAGLFLAGPSIWMAHFFAVYLPAEALCQGDVEAEVLGVPAVSVLTLGATALALAATARTTQLAHRRWRSAGGGWEASQDATPSPGAAARDHDGELALAGFLLGVLFALAILFVGLPALVLSC